jgi:glyoxylase-like metal-dependent hydrolase (beta-lactamase superfamily II)
MEGPVEIAPGVHGLGTEIVNWYLVEVDDRLVAVDSGLPKFEETLDADLAVIGRKREDVEAVVLTHSDGDHTGLAAPLREAGARVLIHGDDDATLRKPGPKSGDGSPRHLIPYMVRPAFWRFMGHMAKRGGGKPPKIEGAETFADGDVLDVPGSPRVVHTPGHTPGHSSIVFDGLGVLFAGDALCTWNPLTGDRVPQLMPAAFNASNVRCVESLGALIRVDAQLMVTGHGEPWHGTPADAVARARDVARR